MNWSAARAFAVMSVVYLVYLAFRIATSTVGTLSVDTSTVVMGTAAGHLRSSTLSGFLLGVSNPKAYGAEANAGAMKASE